MSPPDPFAEEDRALNRSKLHYQQRYQHLLKEGRRQEAEEVMQEGEAYYPDLHCLAEWRRYTAEGDLAAAEQAIRTAVEIHPDSVDTRMDLVETLVQRENYSGAVEQCRKVLELDPTHGPAWLCIGDCSKQQGDLPQAIVIRKRRTRLAGANASGVTSG